MTLPLEFKLDLKRYHVKCFFQLEYRMPLDRVRCRTLQATVWDCDQFRENIFLGEVKLELADVDLTKETSKWFRLANYTRMPRQ